MSKQIAKNKATERQLTLRLDKRESKILDECQVFTDRKTGSGCLMYMAESFIELSLERDRLENELADALHQFNELTDKIKDRNQLDKEIEAIAKANR